MYSLETRIKALAVAGLMAASVAGGTMTAFANVTTYATPNVKKNVFYPAYGVTLENQIFLFEGKFVKSSLSDKTVGTTDTEKGTIAAPAFLRASIDTSKMAGSEGKVSATSALKVGTAETRDFSRDTELDWDGVVPGCYEYELTEAADAPAKDEYGFGWTYNSTGTKYLLRVYVAAKNVGTEKEPVYSKTKRTVKYTLVDTAAVGEKKEKTQEYDALKTDIASFSNIYTKRGGSVNEGDPALTVSKTANGEYDDQTREFAFYISFTYPTVAGEEVKPHYTEGEELKEGIVAQKNTGDDGAMVNVDLKTSDKEEMGQYKFTLKNGEKIAFVNLPAGTTYTVTEAAAKQYKVSSVVLVENGIQDRMRREGEINTAYTPKKDALIGEAENKVEFTNTHETITVTGVVTHSAPFVIMVGALFVAVGGYVVLKKRIEE